MPVMSLILSFARPHSEWRKVADSGLAGCGQWGTKADAQMCVDADVRNWTQMTETAVVGQRRRGTL